LKSGKKTRRLKVIKVLLVDDSAIVHTLIERVIKKTSPDIEVVGNAYNGLEAIQLARKIDFDVMITDVEMPHLNGLEAIAKILEEKTNPIIIFSGAGKKIADLSFQAIELGAVDIIEKPLVNNYSEFEKIIENSLLQKVRLFKDFRVIKRQKSTNLDFSDYTKKHSAGHQVSKKNIVQKISEIFKLKHYPIIAIASSTGGPQTLKYIIQSLPAGFALPIIILQHLSEGFFESFRDWLAGYSKVPICFAKKGSLPEPGNIYIAHSGYHLIFDKNGRFDYNDSPPIVGLRPSADILFTSLAQIYQERVIALILTGMGQDGTEGFYHIKKHNGFTIAQDETSSILYGMPKAAIESGNVDKIINLKDISEYLVKLSLKEPVE